MDDSLRVRHLNGSGDGFDQLCGLAWLHRSSLEPLRKAAAGAKLHGQESDRRTAGRLPFTYFEDLDNIGMEQATNRLGLIAETLPIGRPRRWAGPNHFQSDKSI